MAAKFDEKSADIPRFDCFSDPATIGPRWTRWLNSFELYADGKGLIFDETETAANKKVKQRRRALLLHHAGQDVQDVFVTLAETGGVTDYEKTVAALNKYFVPKVNSSVARRRFKAITPSGTETVGQFATRLRKAVKDCEYGTTETENQIRDEILEKCASNYIRRKCYEEAQGGNVLTLSRTLEIAAQCEEIELQLAELSTGGGTEAEKGHVNRVAAASQKSDKTKTGKSKKNIQCYRCGKYGHMSKDPECPARGKTCSKCQGKDHFATVCRTKDGKKKHEKQEKSGESVKAVDEHYAFTIQIKRDDEPMLDIVAGNKPLKVLIDSGASCNIVGVDTWEDLKRQGIDCKSRATNGKKLYAYASEKPINVKGTFETTVECGSRAVKTSFMVIDGNGVPLLGKETAMNLGVLKIGVDIAAVADTKTMIAGQYPELFRGVGKLNTHQMKIHIREDAKPVAQPMRRIPFNLRGKVERKLDELMKADIIEPVVGPTNWLNPVVVAPKPNGEIRLCLDMRRANEAIVRERHPIPTVDEVLQDLNGSKVFSKLDLKWGYHQMELTPESRDITTFATHKGVFRYKRLLFGVCSASEQYQQEISKVLAGIEGAQNISDDVIVHGADQEMHDKRLHAVLRRLRERGLTLNREKCQFNMNRLVFMGILLTEKGIGPTEERVKAIADAREPESVTELRSFLGLANYSARFIPQFATTTEPLRKLLKKEEPFNFGLEQRAAFKQVKKALAHCQKLAYFQKEATTRVIADVGPVGIGAVLVQEQKGQEVPICYASRSLTSCEKRYSQTEKEALSLVWACEKFHPYIYGGRFSLVTDHKPLEVIYGPRSRPSARIERWVLRLQPYNFDVVHVSGHKNIADPLSHLLPPKHKEEKFDQENKDKDDEYIRFVAVNATPRALSTQEVERESAKDEELDVVREALAAGRFDKCKPYAVVAGELCQIGQLVLRGTRLVIPSKLRARVLALAHEGHLGVVGTKQNLRSKVWWPGIDKAAERYCRSCHGCQLVARPEPPEPVTPTQLPEGPWRDVAVDLMGPLPSGHSLLVVVDYYSKYQDTLVMQSTTTEKVIECLEDTFARHGIPVTLKSDNGPQFVSGEFKNFCQDNNIEHCKTTPRWAQAIGEVERQNRSLLKRLQIAQAEKLDWRGELRKYLFQYRSVAHTTTGRSPAELLFNRKLRTKIPENSSLQPFDQDVQDRDSEQKAKSKMYADLRRGAQPSEVEVGDHVLLKQDKQNKLTTNFGGLPHEVLSKLGNSLIVQSPDGVQYRRNTSHVHRYVSRENEDMDRGPDAEPELPAVRPEVSDAPPVTPAAPVEPLRRSQRTIQKPARYRE